MAEDSRDKFEQNSGKIITGLVAAGLISGIGLLLNIDKRLALVEAQLESAAQDRWTGEMHRAYATGVSAEIEALRVRVARNERELEAVRGELP